MNEDALRIQVHALLNAARENGVDQLSWPDVRIAAHMIAHAGLGNHHVLDLIEHIKSWKRKRYH